MVPAPVDPAQHTFRSPKFASVVREAVQFLAGTPVHTLPPGTNFEGVGVYVLYYTGTFELYDYIARVNQHIPTQPIYVGKAVPRGWRTSRKSVAETNRELYSRLREHAHSLDVVQDPEVEDFLCRFTILNDIESDLITALEAFLIRQHKPLWNAVVDGFGNHDPGSGRYHQARSEWDVLHPGRPWAERLTGPSPRRDEIVAKVQQARDSSSLA